jgi:Lrp/AsnC family leucine-responsive transcriptional regulator
MVTIVPGETGQGHGKIKGRQSFCLHNPCQGAPMPGADPSLLDDVNRRLLAELHADPRTTMSALARRVGMSAPAVTERVQRLERAGVITGYRMDVDPAALGLPVAAYVRIRPTAGQLPRIAELAASIPTVTECHRITGEDCFLLKVHAAAIADLEETLDRFLLFGQTVSSIVVTSPVPPRALPVQPADQE